MSLMPEGVTPPLPWAAIFIAAGSVCSNHLQLPLLNRDCVGAMDIGLVTEPPTDSKKCQKHQKTEKEKFF